jgi:hypothetical protein
MLRALDASGESAVVSDLRQLLALCNREDSEAFLPLESEELTGTAARREIQFSDIVDEVAQQLVSEGLADVTGLRASASKGWYGKYMSIGRCGCLLHYSAWKWNTLAATPLWLQVRGPKWKYIEALNEHLARGAAAAGLVGFTTSDGFEFALFPPLGVEREAVIANLLNQLRRAIPIVTSAEFAGGTDLETPVGESGVDFSDDEQDSGTGA